MAASDRSERWVEEGRSDLTTAQLLMEAGRHNACVFYCQQSAEKTLKGLLLRLNQAPWGHSVWNLYLNVTEFVGESDGDVETAAKGLDLHYAPTRYPDALPGGATPSEFYGKEQASEALVWASKVMEFATRFM